MHCARNMHHIHYILQHSVSACVAYHCLNVQNHCQRRTRRKTNNTHAAQRMQSAHNAQRSYRTNHASCNTQIPSIAHAMRSIHNMHSQQNTHRIHILQAIHTILKVRHITYNAFVARVARTCYRLALTWITSWPNTTSQSSPKQYKHNTAQQTAHDVALPSAQMLASTTRVFEQEIEPERCERAVSTLTSPSHLGDVAEV